MNEMDARKTLIEQETVTKHQNQYKSMHSAISILLPNKTAEYNHAMGIYNDGNDASNVKFYHGIIVSHVILFVQ